MFQTPQGPLDLTLQALTVAGWTGRNVEAVEHHIRELEAIGVPRPSTTPLFYRMAPSLLAVTQTLHVLGSGTSGEVEPLIVRAAGQDWLGLASDHTDRDLEAHSVALSKQVCGKPAAAQLWPLSEVAPHLDQVQIRSRIFENDTWVVYQDGTLASLMPLPDLISSADMPDNSALLCGTVAAIGGVRPSDAIQFEMHDPVLNRSIQFGYDVQVLPIVA